MSVDDILNQIPEPEAAQKNVTEITVVKKPPTQKTVNTILLVAAAIIFIVIIASYFVDLNIFAYVTFKELTTGAILIFIGSYSISSIFKQISINRAKQSVEYLEQKEKTKETLKKYVDNGDLIEVDAYCKAWEEKTLIIERERHLKPVGITYERFLNKYLAKSFFWLRKNCKDLSMKQIIAITQANSVKIQSYDADFLRYTIHTTINKSPSKRFDVERKNMYHIIKTIIFMIMGSFFAYSITQDLVVSFSIASVIAAGIKVAIIFISVAFATSFGWNLIMVTEINRLKLQEGEAEACAKWAKAHFKKGDE